MNVTDPSGSLIRWRLRLVEFKYEIKYKRGIFNAQTDVLLRLTTDGGTVLEADED